MRGVGQHFGDQIEVASRVSCPPARRGRGLTCLGRKDEDRMHFTFFYDGAAERTAEYPTLEEAVRSIELGQVDRTRWSIQYMDREGGNSGLPIPHEPRRQQ